MWDQNRFNKMGSSSGGALTDLYGKMMSSNQGGNGSAMPGAQAGGGLSGMRIGINPPRPYDQSVRRGK
mgnify:FL=1